jgi:hypothetical protein
MQTPYDNSELKSNYDYNEIDDNVFLSYQKKLKQLQADADRILKINE